MGGWAVVCLHAHPVATSCSKHTDAWVPYTTNPHARMQIHTHTHAHEHAHANTRFRLPSSDAITHTGAHAHTHVSLRPQLTHEALDFLLGPMMMVIMMVMVFLAFAGAWLGGCVGG